MRVQFTETIVTFCFEYGDHGRLLWTDFRKDGWLARAFKIASSLYFSLLDLQICNCCRRDDHCSLHFERPTPCWSSVLLCCLYENTYSQPMIPYFKVGNGKTSAISSCLRRGNHARKIYIAYDGYLKPGSTAYSIMRFSILSGICL